MRKILLDKNKNFYKANLHCHSTVSDGAKTPEELKQMYRQKGYSILAYTDHNVLIDHSDLSDDTFLALNGFELDITEVGQSGPDPRTCHLCYIALAPDNLTLVCYHRTRHIWGNAQKYREVISFDPSKPDFEREYTPACINAAIAEGRNNGFFVTYNHPSWSLETYDIYTQYHGMNAMEICNYGCVESGHTDYNEKEYDDMLRGGERIYCIAADDNHNHREDSFGGFTFINADRLAYTTITDAMVAGKLYASEGPEIYSLWYEDGRIGIECSAATGIRLNTANRRTSAVYATEDKPLTSAVFDVKDEDHYVRITVTDAGGRHANTIAYFVDELKRPACPDDTEA